MIRIVFAGVAATILTSLAVGAAAPIRVPVRATAETQYAKEQKCPRWSGGSGMLHDGDFSEAPYPGSSWITYGRGVKFAPRWTVRRRTIDFVGGYFAPPQGVCSIDLDGDFALGSIGKIAHEPFDTVEGTRYTVTFLFSGNGFSAPTVKTMVVRAAGQSQIFTWNVSNGNDAQNGDFQTESWTFTALGPKTRLEFASHDPARSCCGPVIAAIAVELAPSSTPR